MRLLLPEIVLFFPTDEWEHYFFKAKLLGQIDRNKASGGINHNASWRLVKISCSILYSVFSLINLFYH